MGILRDFGMNVGDGSFLVMTTGVKAQLKIGFGMNGVMTTRGWSMFEAIEMCEKMGIEVQSEKDHADIIEEALEIAGRAMQRGSYSTGVSALEKVTHEA